MLLVSDAQQSDSAIPVHILFRILSLHDLVLLLLFSL